jgi:adenylate cyclase
MAQEPKGELVPIGGGDAIPLIRDHLTIGRRESCDVCLRFPNVSGVHAELSFRDGYWFIKDLNSTNGIKVNGVRVPQKVLLPGDEVRIAKRRFNIQYELMAGRRALEELMEEDIDDVLSQSLLERAGLMRPRRDQDGRPRSKPAPDVDWTEEDDE